MTVDGEPNDVIQVPPSPASLPTIPAWVPPLDTGQPNTLDLNDLGTLPKANFAAANQIIPITHGRDRLFGQPFVVHVDETLGYLYTAMSFCEGQIAGFEKTIIDGEDALVSGVAFQGVKNRGFENGDKTGWDVEADQDGTVNNSVSNTGDWGINIPAQAATEATQTSNRLKAPPEATVMIFKVWAARNATPTSLPDTDSLLIIKEASTVGGSLSTSAGVVQITGGDQTVAGFQLLEIEYTVPAGVVEYVIGLQVDDTGTAVGSWDFDDVTAHIFDIEDDEIEVGIEVTAYVGSQSQVFDGMLSSALTGYVDDLPGLAYIVMRCPNGSTQGFPRLEAIIQGRLVYDPRLDSSAGALGPELTFTRASEAWFKNWEGVYNECDDDEPRMDASRRVKNWLLESEAFDTGWTETELTVVEGAADSGPKKGTVAWTMTDNTTDSHHFLSRVVGWSSVAGTKVESIWVKQGTHRYIGVARRNYTSVPSSRVSVFDLQEGVFTFSPTSHQVFVAETTVDGWYRIAWAYDSSTGSDGNFVIGFYDGPLNTDHTYIGTGTTFFIQGAQAEQIEGAVSRAPQEYQKTTGTRVSRTYNRDLQGTLLPAGRGYHHELTGINVIDDSNDIDTGNWTELSGPNTMVSAAERLFEGHLGTDWTNNNGGTFRGVQQTQGTFTDGEDECFSVILENIDAVESTIGIYDNTDANWLYLIDLTWSTKTAATNTGTGNFFVEDLGIGPNGGDMVRLTVVGTGTATGAGGTGQTIRVYLYPTGGGTNALSVIVYHTQFERDTSKPSSPIVVVGTGDVTRSPDNLDTIDLSFLDITQGTLLAKGTRVYPGSQDGLLVEMHNDATSERIGVVHQVDNDAAIVLVDTTSQATLVVTDGFGTGTGVNKSGQVAISWALNNVELYSDGTRSGTGDQAATIPANLTRMDVGKPSGGGNQYEGFIEYIRYYNVIQDGVWMTDATNDLIDDGGSSPDPSLVMAFNFGRDMSIQGIGAAGGQGAHRVDDSTTWEFSQNPTLHFRDIVENFTGWDVLDEGVIANANHNDELIDGIPRRQTGLTMARPLSVEAWIKGHRTYMGAFLNWEGGKIRVIPNRPTVEAPGAIDLDATAGTEVNMGDQSVFDFSTTDFSIEVSAFPRTLSDDKVLVSKKATAAGIDDGYAIYTRADGEVRVSIGDSSDVTTGQFAGVLTAGQYSNLAFTVDRTAEEMSLYVDGVVHASSPVDTTSVGSIANTEDFVLGDDGGGSNAFDGFIDEVRVWGDVRTPAEILANHNKELDNPTADTSLLAYWKLNEGSSAAIAADSSLSGIIGTLGGAAVFGSGNQQVIPDGVAMHIGVDDIVAGSLNLKRRSLRAVPNSVAVDYEDSSGTRWFTARTQADSVRVSGNQEARRLSRVSLPGIHNASQAQREAVERLNWYLTDLDCTLTLFDEGWELTHGSIVAVTHPIGLDAKLFRVRQTTGKSGRWTVDLTEYDPAVYSDTVVADPTIPDTNLGNPLNPPTPTNLVLAEELFNYKTGTTGSRVRVTWAATGYPFLSQYLVEAFVAGAKVWQTTTQANNIVSPPVEEIVDAIGTPTDYEVRVSIQSPFASGTPAIDNVQIDGKFAIPGDPTGAVAIQTFADEVDITWVAAVDIDIWRYEVRRGTTSDSWATAASLILVDGLAYTDTGLALGTHRYFIKAIDSVKQESANAAFVDVTLTAPTAVAGLFGFEVASEVRLNWAAVTGEFVERYRIAYSDQPETFETTLDVVDTIRFSTKDVPEGTFTFKAYSVDKAGNEAATAATVSIEVTSDADAFLADTYDFSFRPDTEPDIVANGSLTNFVEWEVRTDSKTYYVTNMADSFAVSPTDFVAADPLANYHSTGASEWLSETKDFGLLLTGSWNLTHDTVALLGIIDIALELSTDDVTYVSFGGSAKGEFRYARVRISTLASPGTATAFAITPIMNLKINVVPLEESGESVSSPTAGVGKTINLTREYTALKEITTQPKNTIASGSAVTSIVDNIVIGPNTALLFDGVSYLLGSDADFDFGTADFSFEFYAKNDGTAANGVILAKKNTSTSTGWECMQTSAEEIRVTLDDGTVDLDINTTGNAFPDDGAYHHVAVSIDRTGDLCKIRIDGVEEASGDISTQTLTINNSIAFTIGARATPNAFFAGAIDEVRIWDDLRTPTEFDDNKDAPLDMTVAHAGLVGYWLMDGDVGSQETGVVPDETVSGHDLTETLGGTLSYVDPGNNGNPLQKINSFDVFIFDTFGQQLGEQFQWKWKAV